MRRKETRPTLIYWLLDIRPETISAGWHSGKPFYCGKTVYTAEFRLRNHRAAAVKAPHRPISIELARCGEHVEARIMQVVPAGENWHVREQYWIRAIRVSFGAVNVSDGGDGPSGLVHSEESRAKISAAKRGKKMHPSTSAALVKANTGRKKTATELEKIGAVHRGKAISEETRAKLRAVNPGKTRSVQTEVIPRSKIREKHTAERRANISKALKGKKYAPRSPEHCAKIAANKRAWHAARKGTSVTV